MVERSHNQRHRISSIPPAERRSRIKTRPDALYANGSVVKEYIYGEPPQVLVKYDPSTHLTISRYSGLEPEVTGMINRLTLTKGHHTRLVGEFKRVMPTNGEDMYWFEIHTPHKPKDGIYPVIRAHSLTDLDLAIGLVLSNGDPVLETRVKETGLQVDDRAKRFFAKTKFESRSHLHPHNT